MPISAMDVGVTLSHLKVLLVTASDSSPVRLHDSEYPCPSLAAGPLWVIASVSVGAVMVKAHHDTYNYS